MNETTTPVSGPLTPETRLPTKGVNFAHPCAGVTYVVDAEKAIVDEYLPDGVTRRTKVAIVGFAMSSAMDAPWDNPEYSVWGMNQLYRHIPRADRWFDIHYNWNEFVVDGTDHEGWLKSFPGPIYNVARIPGIPNCLAFPLQDCIAIGADYFTSSIAFMIALALRDGFTTIELYGIDLVVGEEYEYQKPCAEFWLGVAQGRGATIGLHKNTALLKQSYRYGYESEPQSLVKMTELHLRLQWLQKERQKRMVEIANLDGAMQDSEMWLEMATLRSRYATVAYEPPK
jgi:hypothetical protein